MSAPYGSPAIGGRRPSTASATSASPTGSGWSAGTRDDENRPPVSSTVAGWSRRNGIALVGVVDGAQQVALRVAPRLAELHAVAALGLDLVDHRRRPVAAGNLADDRRVRQAVRGHERVGLGSVARRLVACQGRDERLEVVERGYALAAHRRMRGAARAR